MGRKYSVLGYSPQKSTKKADLLGDFCNEIPFMGLNTTKIALKRKKSPRKSHFFTRFWGKIEPLRSNWREKDVRQ